MENDDLYGRSRIEIKILMSQELRRPELMSRVFGDQDIESLSSEVALSYLCDFAESWPLPKFCYRYPYIRFAVNLVALKNLHEEGSRTALMNAIVASKDFSFSTPLWAHERLSDAFMQYEKLRGKKDLATILGFAGSPGRGKFIFDDEDLRTEKVDIYRAYRLLRGLGFRYRVCCLIIERAGFYSDFFEKKLKFLSGEQIKKIYEKTKKHKGPLVHSDAISGREYDDHNQNSKRSLELYLGRYGDAVESMLESSEFATHEHYWHTKNIHSKIIESVNLLGVKNAGG